LKALEIAYLLQQYSIKVFKSINFCIMKDILESLKKGYLIYETNYLNFRSKKIIFGSHIKMWLNYETYKSKRKLSKLFNFKNIA
jgi:hypothetical protein